MLQYRRIIGAVFAVVSIGAIAPHHQAAAAPSGVTSIVPARLLDTRPGGRTVDGIAAGRGVVSFSAIDVPVTGRGGVPATGVDAVIVNVTAVNGRADAGYLTVYPTGASRPETSALNFNAGTTVANELVTKVGAGGKISIYAFQSVDVLVDVVGWVASGPTTLTPLVPARLLDTRRGGRTIDGSGVGAGAVSFSSVDVVATGRGGVPSTRVAAVIVNVTAVNGRANGGYLTVYPAGATRPEASSINFNAGTTVANELVAKVGAGGKITIYGHQAADVLVDVVGWIADPASSLISMIPNRLADTRAGGRTIDGLGVGGGPIGSSTLDVVVTGRAGVPSSGVGAVIVNVTAVNGRADNGFLSVYPSGTSRPNASSANFNRGTTVANEVIAKVGGGGKIAIYVDQSADILVDIVGWIPGEPAPVEPPPSPPPTTPPPTTTPPPPAAQKFLAVYARPAGTPETPGRREAIAHEVGVVQTWYDGQTGGRHPVFARNGPEILVLSVQLPYTAAELAATDEADSATYINGLAELGGALPVIYLDATLNAGYCGVTTYVDRPTVVIPMPNCDIYPEITSSWPYNATYLLGHEITHALGAVDSCAPHHAGGHVSDDPRDVIYSGPKPRIWDDLRLDVGNDDYYAHSIAGCTDIADNPLLGTG